MNFRANPKKVRVSIRKINRQWLCRIVHRTNPIQAVAWFGDSPEETINHTLMIAEKFGIDGIYCA